MTKYMHGERKRAEIIAAGVDLWRTTGIQAVSARGIAKAVGLNSHASVLHHFANSAELVRAVKQEAIAQRDPKLICQLVASSDPLVAGWTAEVKTAWVNAGLSAG